MATEGENHKSPLRLKAGQYSTQQQNNRDTGVMVLVNVRLREFDEKRC